METATNLLKAIEAREPAPQGEALRRLAQASLGKFLEATLSESFFGGAPVGSLWEAQGELERLERWEVSRRQQAAQAAVRTHEAWGEGHRRERERARELLAALEREEGEARRSDERQERVAAPLAALEVPPQLEAFKKFMGEELAARPPASKLWEERRAWAEETLATSLEDYRARALGALEASHSEAREAREAWEAALEEARAWVRVAEECFGPLGARGSLLEEDHSREEGAGL